MADLGYITVLHDQQAIFEELERALPGVLGPVIQKVKKGAAYRLLPPGFRMTFIV